MLPITILISCPRDATRRVLRIRWPGSSCTTCMRTKGGARESGVGVNKRAPSSRLDAHAGIPMVDISALFQPKSAKRDATDAAILAAAGDIGFLSIVGLPATGPMGCMARTDLLRIFRLEKSVLRGLWRRKFAPRNRNVYRGWFPVQPSNLTSKAGIDIGADVA